MNNNHQLTEVMIALYEEQTRLLIGQLARLRHYASSGVLLPPEAVTGIGPSPVAGTGTGLPSASINNTANPNSQPTTSTSPTSTLEKKGKKSKSNQEPKRMSGYQLFIQEQMLACRTEGAKAAKERFTQLSRIWHGLPPDTKRQYTTKAIQITSSNPPPNNNNISIGGAPPLAPHNSSSTTSSSTNINNLNQTKTNTKPIINISLASDPISTSVGSSPSTITPVPHASSSSSSLAIKRSSDSNPQKKVSLNSYISYYHTNFFFSFRFE